MSATPLVRSGEDPLRISVAIACHNAAAYVGDAIRSALAQSPAPAEVVVCDDGSTDGSPEVLQSFGEAIRVVRHEVNRGEAAAKNTAVGATTSPWVALLDADDEFLPGRLAAVRDLLTREPDLDVVTTDALLVHDGVELGRWYGAHYPFAADDQRRAVLERNFVFGNVVVRRDAFLASGGFDPAIAHATDWDLWIRMIHSGARVGCIPRPLARYRLHESSLSSDRAAMSASIAALLTRAAERLALTDDERSTVESTAAEHERIATRYRLKQALTRPASSVRRLATAVARDSGQPTRSRVLALGTVLLPTIARRAERRRSALSWEGPGGVRLPRRRRRVLVTLPDRPWPTDGGKRTRSATSLRALAGMPDVDLDVLVLFAGPPVDHPLPPGVRTHRCVQVDAGPRPRLLTALVVVLRRVPWQIAVRRWGLARAAVRDLRQAPYDLVWFGSTDHAMSLSRTVRGQRVVVDMDDVESLKIEHFLSLPPDSRTTRLRVRVQRRVELPLWRRLERHLLRSADAVVVCSDLDRQRLGDGPVEVVRNTYAGPPVQAAWTPPAAPTFVLVGTYWYVPNVDAAVHMATSVLPHLLERVPDARIRFVGRGGRDLLGEVTGLPGVDVVGDVTDVAPELLSATAAVVPVRFGGGTRVKILEAFALGVPVVSTSLGCEGLDVVDGVHLLVADSPEEFAGACARLTAEPEVARRLGDGGRRLYLERYAPTQVVGSARAVAERVLTRQ
ncbi:glycosyltransferase [Geodermatophilus aquaeductus]|uniref:glycosyltransferase n=1 Tax=Geodermatophilus aquaeductus TaxID=1564161 RepID=UPI00163CCB9C|nr:glycosyltransferase [Geodermatophilus aquaeductus]